MGVTNAPAQLLGSGSSIHPIPTIPTSPATKKCTEMRNDAILNFSECAQYNMVRVLICFNIVHHRVQSCFNIHSGRPRFVSGTNCELYRARPQSYSVLTFVTETRRKFKKESPTGSTQAPNTQAVYNMLYIHVGSNYTINSTTILCNERYPVFLKQQQRNNAILYPV